MIGMTWLRCGLTAGVLAVAAMCDAALVKEVATSPAVSAPTTLAPLPQFRAFGSDNGLPSSRVYKIAQDRDGFVWFATADGLARHDGAEFRSWRNEPADAGSLGGNATSALLIDRDNRVWVGIEDVGLDLLDAQRKEFRHFRHRDGEAGGLPTNDVWALAQDRDGALWIGTFAAGLVRFDPAVGRVVTQLRHDDADAATLASDNVLSLLADADGTLWIGTDRGLDRRAADGALRHVDLHAWHEQGGGLKVMSLSREGDAMVAGTSRGALRINAQLAAQPAVPGEPAALVYGQASARDGTLWLATRRGLVQRAADGRVRTFVAQPGVRGSLGGNALYDVLVDHEQGLWLATFDSGVAYLSPQWRNFTLWQQVPGSTAGLSAQVPTALAPGGDGAVWSVNSGGGIDRLQPDSGHVEQLGERIGLDGAHLSVLLDRGGRLWLGAANGLDLVDAPLRAAGRRHFEVDAKRPEGMLAGTVDLLAEDADGAVWAAVAGKGVVRIGGDGVPHGFRAGDAGAPRSGDIEQLGVDARGTLWIAHADGLDWCERPCARFAAVPGAPAARVQAFDFAVDGSLWLAQFGALEHWRVDDAGVQLIEHFDAGDGWPALNAYGLALDAQGRVWVTSSRGLYRFDPAARTVRRFDAGDGLPGGEFTDRNLRRDARGRLFAGTREGLLAFDPALLADNTVAPPLRLDALSVQRGDARVALPARADIDVDWRDRDLRLTLRALTFAAPPRYQTRLHGLDRDWIDTPRGEREFGQLAPGDYRLEARAANAAGVWTTLAQAPRFDVAAPPWRRWWAWLGYALALAAALALAFRAWRRRVQRRHEFALAQQRRELAEQASAAKSDFLAHMGHEIRTPMTGLLGMSELLLRSELSAPQRGFAEGIAASGQHMLRLVNDALDLARIEAGKLELEREAFDPAQLLRQVGDTLRPLATAKQLACEVRSGDNLPRAVLGDARRVLQILLNLGNNAVKFTTRGGVTLSLHRDGDALVYAVKDSGAGISLEQQQRLFQRYAQTDGGRRAGGSGLGLAICRELAELMRGRIELDSAPGQGSEFRLVLPLEIAGDDADISHAFAASAGIPAGELAHAGTHEHASTRAPAPAHPHERADVRADAHARTLSLLLVEDDATAAATLRGLLELLGHRVRHAPHGLAALTELEQGGIDIVLCDLDLPGLDGLAVVRTWRAREAQRGIASIPFVALTARTEGDTEARVHAAGMQGFQRKPVTTAMLAKVLAPWTAPPR